MNRKQNRRPGANRNGGNKRGQRQEHHSTNGAGLPSDVPIGLPDGRVIGHVVNKVFKKNIEERLYLKRPVRAIALDIQTLKDAEAAGATSVEIIDRDTGQVYCASIERIWRDGEEFNRGWGWQIYLPIGAWTRPGELRAEQPSLFGGSAP